jgi:hypothetical protein
MNLDPIVDAVRKAGAKLASESGNDVHRFFEKLRHAQKGYGKPLVRTPVPRYEETGTTHQAP